MPWYTEIPMHDQNTNRRVFHWPNRIVLNDKSYFKIRVCSTPYTFSNRKVFRMVIKDIFSRRKSFRTAFEKIVRFWCSLMRKRTISSLLPFYVYAELGSLSLKRSLSRRFFLHHNHYMYWCNIEYLVRISKQYFFGRRKVSNCVLKNWLAQYSNTLIRGCIWLNANQKEAQRERTTTTKPPNSLLQLNKIRYRLSFFADLFLKWSCRESNGLMYAKKIEATASCLVLHIQRSWKQSA